MSLEDLLDILVRDLETLSVRFSFICIMECLSLGGLLAGTASFRAFLVEEAFVGLCDAFVTEERFSGLLEGIPIRDSESKGEIFL